MKINKESNNIAQSMDLFRPFVMGDICYIPLKGGIAICDADDFEIVNNVDGEWYMGNGYPYANKKGVKKYNNLCLHRLLNPEWKITDHINGDTLDNRRSNLRECTHQQNMRNRKSANGSSSIYKGVRWDKGKQRWRATIRMDNKERHLGYFQSEKNAAKAYDKKAIELFGEFARPNFIDNNLGPQKNWSPLFVS